MFVVNSGTELISDLLCFALQCMSFFFFGFFQKMGETLWEWKGKDGDGEREVLLFLWWVLFLLIRQMWINWERERALYYLCFIIGHLGQSARTHGSRSILSLIICYVSFSFLFRYIIWYVIFFLFPFLLLLSFAPFELQQQLYMRVAWSLLYIFVPSPVLLVDKLWVECFFEGKIVGRMLNSWNLLKKMINLWGEKTICACLRVLFPEHVHILKKKSLPTN